MDSFWSDRTQIRAPCLLSFRYKGGQGHSKGSLTQVPSSQR